MNQFSVWILCGLLLTGQATAAEKAGEAPDLPLQPGDRIHIPESWL